MIIIACLCFVCLYFLVLHHPSNDFALGNACISPQGKLAATVVLPAMLISGEPGGLLHIVALLVFFLSTNHILLEAVN